jgi:AraC-like DNA-binding protein
MLLERTEPDRQSTISAGAARALIHAASRAGVSRERLLDAANVAALELERPDARTTRAEFYALCTHAVELSVDPALGVHCTEYLSGHPFDFLPELVVRAATLRAGLEALSEFRGLHEDQPSYQIVEQDDYVYIVCESPRGEPLSVQRFVSEVILIGFWRLIGGFGAHTRPRRASFQYEAPGYRDEYARIFVGAETFEQSFTGIAFDRALLDLPSPHRDPEVYDLLRSLAERRLSRLTQRAPYAQQVREQLQRIGVPRKPAMDVVARALGLSVRTLRRRLGEEGVTFDQVTRQCWTDAAKHLLASSQLTIQETSHALGFSYTSAFHRAFKRLTGMTPLEYRSHHQLL